MQLEQSDNTLQLNDGRQAVFGITLEGVEHRFCQLNELVHIASFGDASTDPRKPEENRQT